MNKGSFLLIVIFLILAGDVSPQNKFRLSAFTGSGISSFRGSGVVSHSVYYRNGIAFPGNVDTMAQPYGRKVYPNFLAGLQGELDLSSKWILLFSAQYENTGAGLTGDSVLSPSGNIMVNGTYTRHYDNISLNPQIGLILSQKKLRLLVHTGIDYTSKLAMGNHFEYTEPGGNQNSIAKSGGEPEVNDLRLTTGASVSLKKWTFNINYKHGIVNYLKYGTGEAYTRILHFRLMYTLWGKNT